MKKIKALYNRLQQKSFEERYPNYNPHDNKIHLLYIAPCLNKTGLYRALLPALELEKTGDFSVILSSLNKWDFTKGFNDYDNPVDEKLIMWADYFILPSIATDISYIINPISQLNPDIQFVMDLDLELELFPKNNPHFMVIPNESRSQFLYNLSRMDMITGSSNEQLEVYEEIMLEEYPKSNTSLGFIPNLISQIQYEEVKPIERGVGEKVRFGIMADFRFPKNLEIVLEILNGLKDELINQIEVVFCGWNGDHLDKSQLPNDLKISYQKTVSILKYFTTQAELRLDLVLMPYDTFPDSLSIESYIRYTELAALSIPVIISDLPPYNKIIEHGETGFLAENQQSWLFYIEALIHEPSERERIGKNAMKNAWSRLSYTHPNLEFFKQTFI